ncbi:hypothetical protein DICSQDRAFT_172243 [Dichomitus squalens LYAD-421 SS1]|uniref:Uncharacterized protein n=1 Tax=Dichomitus squalens (strain LYAD-421) TaxID=732165 RepID=R7SSU5_DICSQ|nr:uncharacterized protein DICSQDRAFT_172243 [Dichomitus squalens LYAD-421 SS1]EJF59259.1 hypothetical protein DICSQDRAFT_172243 [Dichomitus squalens LYAD-421 SS1]
MPFLPLAVKQLCQKLEPAQGLGLFAGQPKAASALFYYGMVHSTLGAVMFG